MVKYTAGIESEARRELAIKLLGYSVIIIFVALVGSMFLVYSNKIEVDKAIMLILAVSTIFSSILGLAMAYYFSSK